MEICLDGGLTVTRPDIDFFIDKLNQPFSFIKLNHAFWQMLNRERYWVNVFHHLHSEQFVRECVGILSQFPKDESFLVGASYFGPPDIPHPGSNTEVLGSLIQKYLGHLDLIYGPIWKYYTQNQTIFKLIDALKKKQVVLIGFPHLFQIKKAWDIDDFTHLRVGVDATIQRYDILDRLRNMEQKGCSTVYIFQLGEMLSSWFIYHLQDVPVIKLDMGRSLDIWVDVRMEKQAAKLWPDHRNQPWIKHVKNRK